MEALSAGKYLMTLKKGTDFCLRDTNPNNLCEFPIDTWLREWEGREKGEIEIG